jgi:hypothetical protein
MTNKKTLAEILAEKRIAKNAEQNFNHSDPNTANEVEKLEVEKGLSASKIFSIEGVFPQDFPLRELFKKILENGELILTIPEEQEDDLRKGLAMAKSKNNIKAKENGGNIEKRTLEYNVVVCKNNAGMIDVHIRLAERKGITVFNIRLPDDTI